MAYLRSYNRKLFLQHRCEILLSILYLLRINTLCLFPKCSWVQALITLLFQSSCHPPLFVIKLNWYIADFLLIQWTKQIGLTTVVIFWLQADINWQYMHAINENDTLMQTHLEVSWLYVSACPSVYTLYITWRQVLFLICRKHTKSCGCALIYLVNDPKYDDKHGNSSDKNEVDG